MKNFLKNISSTKLEIWIHAILLIAYLVVMEYGLGSTFDTFNKNIIRMNFLSVPLIFYTNAFWLIPRYLKKRKWLKYFLLLILIAPLIDILRSIVTVIVFNEVEGNVLIRFAQAFFNDSSLGGGVFLGFVFSFAYRFTKDWIINLTLIEKLDAERATMELAFLKSQVDPHFLFNTLNSLYAVALEENSSATADGIAKLGTLMRYNLHDSQSEFISLRKEIEYIEKYVDLQKLRTTEKNTIQFNVEIDDTLLDQKQVIPMLLIPLVENAFKYGVSPTEETTISIQLKAEKEKLVLDVENTIIQNINPENSTGVGINNLKERLQLLYPDKHSLNSKKKGNTFQAHLKLELVE